MIKRILPFFSLFIILSACAPKEKLIYFQGIQNAKSGDAKTQYEPQLQADDLLLIIISAPDPEAAIPYNLISYSTTEADRSNTSLHYQTYLIDANGNIEFPVIGSMKLGGLTKTEAIDKIKSELKKYIKSPIVNLRIMNYKISVMGEVARPGTYPIETERITLPEALSKAGDLTIYGDRKQVLVIREINGVQTHNFIDITSADFINSPYYYLDQNDQIYVQPNKTKINSSVIGPNITAGLTAISLVITVIALLIR
ncbi:polysaccharide biosynthesis/export family protein [Flavobacterium sp. 3HN19-14]|uniref:polysaccharide biosynthesis/export family protein n=1 Tax=Flavobacterium sp. 3HN19-14 TaxID=3448133 RepID=UPI003EE02F68